VTDALEPLSAEQLHDLAVRHATKHLDVKFFWDLVALLPAAEAASGELDEAEQDVQTLRGHVNDVTDAGRAPLAEALRPFYLDYLREHRITP
jgi:hypothetical protein